MCDKVCYTKKEAESTLRFMKKSGYQHRRETRAYYCNVHNSWHLTSSEEFILPDEIVEIEVEQKEKWNQLLSHDNTRVQK